MKEQEDRAEAIKKLNASMAAKFGSRISKWDMVWNVKADRYVYFNIETHEQRHFKSALCENCDAFIEQNEKQCEECDQPRSLFNMALWRPLGSKDITAD